MYLRFLLTTRSPWEPARDKGKSEGPEVISRPDISPASTLSGFVTLRTSISFPSLSLSLLICEMSKLTFEDYLVH